MIDRSMLDRKLTDEEIKKITSDAVAAMERGDDTEMERLAKLLPLYPYTAKISRDMYGKEYIKEFNLVLANERYGDGWLDREDRFGPAWMD